jgi:hypothetical protein
MVEFTIAKNDQAKTENGRVAWVEAGGIDRLGLGCFDLGHTKSINSGHVESVGSHGARGLCPAWACAWGRWLRGWVGWFVSCLV